MKPGPAISTDLMRASLSGLALRASTICVAISRGFFLRASELHGDRTGDVAVFGHLRAFENDGDAGDAERFERGGNEGGQSLFLLSEHDECRVSDGFVFLIVTVYLFGSEDTSERDRENVTACRPFRQQADAVNVSVPGGHQRLSCVM